MIQESRQNILESRVAKTETAIEAITRDIASLVSNVRDLTGAVRTQGDQTDAQIRNLLVSVTAAAGPHKTEWGVIVSAVGLILAIGVAAFSPMLLRINDLDRKVNRDEDLMRQHETLRLHPVGESRLNEIEKAMSKSVDLNVQGIRDLDVKLQNEYRLINDTLKERSISQATQIKELDVKLQREFTAAGKHTDEKVESLANLFSEVKQMGSPITRERLAAIETRLKQLDADQSREKK